MKQVFLGGTCNGSTWRDQIIPTLKKYNLKYFNPIVNDWTEECMKKENIQKALSDVELYVITPLMTGVYSIAELTQSSNDKNKTTIFCCLYTDVDKNGEQISFDSGQIKSLKAVEYLVSNNGALCCNNLIDCVKLIDKAFNGENDNTTFLTKLV